MTEHVSPRLTPVKARAFCYATRMVAHAAAGPRGSRAGVTPPRLVLVHPRSADNLVSIARAMRTFGLSDWVAVASSAHLVTMLDVLLRHRAPEESDAGLATLRRVDTLAEAVAGCSFVVGTTPRSFEGLPRFTPRELAAHVAARGDPTWALVFGAETNGLKNADLASCHAISYLPSSPEQPSVNLSQAVVIYGHELAQPAPADEATWRQLESSLSAGLCARGFSSDDTEAVVQSLLRADLTAEEAALWTTAWSP